MVIGSDCPFARWYMILILLISSFLDCPSACRILIFFFAILSLAHFCYLFYKSILSDTPASQLLLAGTVSIRLGIMIIIDNALANKRMYFVYENWAKMLMIVSTRDSGVTIYM